MSFNTYNALTERESVENLLAEAGNVSEKDLKYVNRKLIRALQLAVAIIELSQELLPVAERNQDDEWYEKEKLVHASMPKIIERLNGLGGMM